METSLQPLSARVYVNLPEANGWLMGGYCKLLHFFKLRIFNEGRIDKIDILLKMNGASEVVAVQMWVSHQRKKNNPTQMHWALARKTNKLEDKKSGTLQ